MTADGKRRSHNSQRSVDSHSEQHMSGWLAALCLVFGLASWTGVGYLVLTYPPSSLTLAVFYPLFFLAVTGMVVPIIHVLHRAFPVLTGGRPSRAITLRQSVWAGLFVTSALGLQAERLRDPVLMVILGAILVLTETYLQQRGW